MTALTDAATPRGFPHSLLDAPAAARLAYFRDYTLAHPHLKEADARLAAALDEPASAGLVMVYGPTGTGKTTLLRRTLRRLTEAAFPALATDPGRIPVVGLEAVSPDARSFNWADYWRRGLAALDEPLISDKRAPDPPLQRGVVAAGKGSRADSAAALRWAWEQALRHRRPVAVLIDEAQALAKVSSARTLEGQLDCVKSQANLTGVVHVLFGTYGLLAFRNLSGQLSRRSIDIHLPRYRLEEAGDAEAFQRVLRAFQRHLPLAEEPDLLGQWDFCYERSIGCVGTLKDWLTKAYAAALREEAPTLTRAHLEAHAFSPVQCLTMITEARQDEAELAGEGEARDRLLALLRGAPPRPKKTTEQQPARAMPRAHGPVGRRTLGRDPVGEQAHGR